MDDFNNTIDDFDSFNETASILETVENKEPEEIPSGEILKKIPPQKWEAFTTILEFLTRDSDDAVIVNDSIITHILKSSGILKVDLTEVFDNEKINLHISSPKKWVRLFKMMKNENIFIINETNMFIVTNGQIKLFLPKQISSVVTDAEFPDFIKTETICNFILQKESRDKILNLGKSVTYIEFLLQNNLLKCINIPNTAIYILPEFIKDADARKLTSATADITLRTSSFLPYSSETYNIIIGKSQVSDSYFMFSTCIAQMMKIEIYEPLDNASGIESLF